MHQFAELVVKTEIDAPEGLVEDCSYEKATWGIALESSLLLERA